MTLQIQAFIVVLVGLSTIGLATGNPTKLQQAAAPSTSSLIGSQGSSGSSKLASAGINKEPGTKLATAGSVSSSSASLVNVRPSSTENKASVAPNSAADLDAFDGKNPFADDSLWQIPVHLVRDLSSNDEALTKSASEYSPSAPEHMAEDGDMDSADEAEVPLQAGHTLSSSSSPTIISASTDLKTAAGYHYPSSHGHHGGYHGGHHGADHYGGKYFQYASVPYPYAWEFGYRRGNPYHTIERYEHGKGPHFQTKVKWSDKHGGYGVHVWDYNHDDHHSHHYGGHHESHGPSHYGHGSHHGGHYGHH